MSVKRTVTSLKGRTLFSQDFPLYVNKAEETFALTEHSHDFWEIAYVAEGRGFHHIAGEVFPVQRGDAFFIPLGISHVFRPAGASADHRLIVYNCVFGEEIADWIMHTSLSPFPSHNNDWLQSLLHERSWLHLREQAEEFGTLMDQLHLEYIGRRQGRSMLLLLYASQLLLAFCRRLAPQAAGHSAGEDAAGRQASLPSRADEALELIRRRCHEPLQLADAAAAVGLGERQLQRLIRQAAGQTFQQLLQAARIQRSCKLLRTTELKVYEVAEAAGYQDMKRFHALFKQTTGCSPREYRNRT